MYNKSNNNSEDGLEEFFQKRVEEYDFDFREEDWQKLEAKLDSKSDRIHSELFAFLRIAPPILGLLLLMGAYTYTLQNSISPNESKKLVELNANIHSNTEDTAQERSSTDLAKNQNKSESATKLSNKNLRNKTQVNPQLNQEKDTISLVQNDLKSGNNSENKDFANAQEAPIILPQPKTERESIEVGNEKDNGILLKDVQSQPNIILPHPKIEEEQILREGAENKQGEEDSNNSLATTKSLFQLPKMASQNFLKDEIQFDFEMAPLFQEIGLKRVAANSPKQSKEEAEEQIKDIRPFSRWGLALSFSPDISLTDANNLATPGIKFGILGEYFISRRLSISTGFAYSRVNYDVQGSDYTVPTGFWGRQTQGMVPEEIQAVCDVIDIPINLRYYFVTNGRHKLYASAGLSSYLMLTEDYDYDFMYQGNNPDIANGWNVRNENNHFFGIANFSLGYEMTLNKNWAIQVEPFIKSPLTGIGFGQVNLFSAGSFVNLKYTFGRRRP